MDDKRAESGVNGDAAPDFDPTNPTKDRQNAPRGKHYRRRRVDDEAKSIKRDRALRIGPLIVPTYGILAFPRVAKTTREAWDEMPDQVINDEAVFEAASANSNHQDIEQFVRDKVKAQVYSHHMIKRGLRYAKSAINIATPMLAMAQREIKELMQKIATTTEDICVPEGSWSDLRYFRNFPTLVKIVVSLCAGYYMIEFELLTMMKYVTAAFPKLVLGTKLSSLAWLTPARTALAMTAVYLIAMYYILEYLLHSAKSVLNLKMSSRLRIIMAVVALATPFLFAWVTGIAYESHDIRSDIGKLFTPGMPAYMFNTMWLCVLGLAAITWFLKEQVDLLLPVHRMEPPVRAYDKSELNKALRAQECCQDVLSQAEAVLESVKVTAANAEANAVSTLWEELADRRARADQAYIKNRRKPKK